MATQALKEVQGKLARPLNTLASLIKEKIREADEAAEAARQPYWEELGELLLEAKGQFDTASEFFEWGKRQFDFSETQTRRYLKAVTVEPIHRARGGAETLSDAIRAVGGTPRGSPRGGHREWTAPVNDIVERAKREAERLRDEELTRQQEREAERKLALRLIDIGFKVLAKEMHPDTSGGPRDAFQRLKRVVERLKAHA